MYHLAVSVGVHDNRVLDYLKNTKELRDNIDFERDVDNFGWANYTFPGMGEDQFRYIVGQLRNSGVTMDQVDTQLTEKKIMKLADLITEWSESSNTDEERPQLFPPGENGFVDLISALQKTLESWKSRYVGGFYTDEKNRADDYQIDLQELIEMYKDKAPKTKSSEMGDYDSKNLSEQKLRKLIRKTIRQ